MKKGTFRKKSYQEIIAQKQSKRLKTLSEAKSPRNPSKNAFKKLKKTKLRLVGHSTTTDLKKEIQATLRSIVIKRDGGCFLRHYTNKITPQYAKCGGYRNDGELILQAEHLHSRSTANSFSDPRLVVCVCQRHHIYYKPQHSAEYNDLAKDFIGTERAELWERVRNDHKPYKVDLKLELLALKQLLKSMDN